MACRPHVGPCRGLLDVVALDGKACDRANVGLDYATPHQSAARCGTMKGCRACRLKRWVHPLFKPEHTVRELIVRRIRIVGIGIVAVIELDNVDTASIDVEMDISFLKVGVTVSHTVTSGCSCSTAHHAA